MTGLTSSNMDLNSFVIFYEVIKAGSLTGAGTNLGLAKSTVSRRLAALERHLNAMLIKKGGRKLTLTEAGTSLYRHCEKIATELDEATREVVSAQSNMQGMLRVSIPSDLGIHWLANLVADFRRKFPEVTIALLVHNNDEVDLIKEPFDIAIQIGTMKPSQLICKRLATLDRGIYASPDYLARRGTPITLDECRQHDWIVTDVQERDGVWLFRRNKKREVVGIARKVVTNSARLAKDLAIKGAGLALILDCFCYDAIRDGRLRRVLLPWSSPPLQVAAVFLSRDRIPRKARTFLEFFAERMKREHVESSQFEVDSRP
jgi:DNA-binding transcriptional LysR family regulator